MKIFNSGSLNRLHTNLRPLVYIAFVSNYDPARGFASVCRSVRFYQRPIHIHVFEAEKTKGNNMSKIFLW